MPQPERDFEKEEKAIAGLRLIARSTAAPLLFVIHDIAKHAAELDMDSAMALLKIAKRIGTALKRTQAIAAANRGEVECRTAEEVLDARIASVVALVLRGEVRGRKLAP